jgi:hypothetical protein
MSWPRRVWMFSFFHDIKTAISPHNQPLSVPSPYWLNSHSWSKLHSVCSMFSRFSCVKTWGWLTMWQTWCVSPVLFAVRLNMLQTWSVSPVLLEISQAPCWLQTSTNILILEGGAQWVILWKFIIKNIYATCLLHPSYILRTHLCKFFCVSMCWMWPQFLRVTWSRWHLSIITQWHVSSSISVHDSTSISLISALLDGFHGNSFSFKEYHKLKSPEFRSGLRGGKKLLQLWWSG